MTNKNESDCLVVTGDGCWGLFLLTHDNNVHQGCVYVYTFCMIIIYFLAKSFNMNFFIPKEKAREEKCESNISGMIS